MIHLTWIPEAIRTLAWLYLIAYLVLLAIALVNSKRPAYKALWAIAVSAGFGYLPWKLYFEAKEARAKVEPLRDEQRQKLDTAKALFEQRCKAAGEKIARTVDNVEGVVWMKWRPERSTESDQFRLDDPYGHDCGGDGCILNLLRVTKGLKLNPADAPKIGYGFVETADPMSGQLLRYVSAMKLRPSWTAEAVAKHKRELGQEPPASIYWATLEHETIERYTARYGISWDDLSTREDREHWIAGGSLKIIDLRSNEVIAERIGYMMDQGQGSRIGFRSPWGDAPRAACPPFPQAQGGGPYLSNRSKGFVFRVLVPAKGE